MGEAAYIALLCGKLLGGEPEITYSFGGSYNRIDCITENFAVEFGLDETASSRDSIVQAIIAAKELKKLPMIVIVDRDHKLGKHEQELIFVCSKIKGLTCLVGFADEAGNFEITEPVIGSPK